MRHIRISVLSALLVASLLLAERPAAAQVAESSGSASIAARLDKIEQLLSNLEKRLEAVEGSSATAHTTPQGEVQATSLADRIEAIDQGLRVVQRKRELEAEAAAAQAKNAAFVTASKDGFAIRSADGAFLFTPHVSLQSDARFFGNGSPAPGTSQFVPFKVRPSFEGTIYKNFSYRIMPDFGNGGTSLQDAYIDASIRPWLKLRGGKYKGPVGLERLVSDTDVEFYERALPTNLVPNRDVGFELFGDLWGGLISYAGGVFNGVPDGGSADLDSDNHHEFEGRLFAQPFRKTNTAALQGIGIGLAGSSGREIGTASSPIVAGYKTSSQLTFFRYRSDGTAAGSVLANGEHSRLAPQANFYWGPFGAWAEYIVSSQEVRRGTTIRSLNNAAWQVAATYVLTGDKATYKSVSPIHSLDLKRGYWGAMELVARIHVLRVDKSAFPVFADPASNPYGARAWTLGFNWYANRNVKFVFNYEQTDFLQIAGGFKRKNENAFLERLQLAW